VICRIAELGVEIPEMGDLPKRIEAYQAQVPVDICIPPDKTGKINWDSLSPDDNIYLNSGFLFYRELLKYEGMLLHASAVLIDGRALLFSGPGGVGKSTHTAKYLSSFPEAVIINDDKPALRMIDGVWKAFGTPWAGKDGINANVSAPLAAVCFLHRGDRKIRRLSPLQIIPQLLAQTIGRNNLQETELLMANVETLIRDIPFFDFYNHAEEGDERITYNYMLKGGTDVTDET